MVVTFLPATALAGVAQDRIALPSRCTVHAPHSAEPQPYFVPVSFRCSRTTHSSGASGSTLTLTDLSLIVKATVAMNYLP